MTHGNHLRRLPALLLLVGTLLFAPQAQAQFLAENVGTIQSLAVNTVNGDLLAATSARGLWRSTDGGITWSETNLDLGYVHDVVVDANGHIYVGVEGPVQQIGVGILGTDVLKSTDDGVTWTNINAFPDATHTYALLLTATHLFAGTATGVYRSADDGTTWEKLTFPGIAASESFESLAINSGGDLYAGTRVSGVYKSTDNGDNWAVTGLASGFIASLEMNSSDHVFATQLEGKVHRSTDGGTNWTEFDDTDGLPDATNVDFNDLAINGDDDLFLATTAGLYSSFDDGATWALTGGLDEPFYSMRFNNTITAENGVDGDILAGGNRSMYRSSDGGLNFGATNDGLLYKYIYDMVVDSNDKLYVGTLGHGVYRSDDGGNAFIEKNNGLTNEHVFSVTVDEDDFVYAATWEDGVFKSQDNGDTWFQQSNGLAGDALYTWALAFDEPNTNLYLGTAVGMYRSTDGGANWADRGLDNKFVRSIHVTEHGGVWAGTLGEFAWFSADGGASWTQVNGGLISNYIFDFAEDTDDDLVYAATSFGVYKIASDASGATWTDVSAGMGNTFVNAIHVNPNNGRVIAGTNNGVYVSDDQGANWTLAGTPFTTTIVYSLAQVGNRIFAGTLGTAGVQGKGEESVETQVVSSLLTADDQGETWEMSTFDGTTSIEEGSNTIPEGFALDQNYPNPFNPVTTISFDLPQASDVQIRVFNVLGQEVALLVNRPFRAGTQHQVTFDASMLPSGVYLYSIEAAGFKATRTMVLLK